jgi:phosphoglycolate phosphatase-like HAD superfamily hydrolase
MILSERDFWIFDMDGTLTVDVHDFDAIRTALGLPSGQPILEIIATMPEMVGDYLFDLVAGRQAGVATVYVDVVGDGQWINQADFRVNNLSELLTLAV